MLSLFLYIQTKRIIYLYGGIMKNKSKYFIAASVTVLTALIIFNSQKSKAGALNGIILCRDIIVPALLPVLILSGAMARSDCAQVFEKLFGKIIQMLFHLPRTAAAPIIFGAIGGYPSGAVLTRQMLNDAMIDSEDAVRIMRFNVNPGIAFTITAVGSVYLKSTKSGVILYLICTAASLLLGIIQGLFFRSKRYYYNADTKRLGFDKAVISSVDDATKSILNMCAYIIFFSAVIKMFDFPKQAIAFLEITSGIFSNDTVIPFEYLCFFLSFAGLCIHFQIFSIARDFDMKYTDFFIHRLFAACLSYFPGKLYSFYFSQEMPVFSNVAQAIPQASQVNAGLSMVLLAGCVAIIFDIKNKKSKLI